MAETHHTRATAASAAASDNKRMAPAVSQFLRKEMRVADPNYTDTEPAEITYQPGPGEPQTTEAFGRTFEAGKAQEVPGRIVDKAKGNPYFKVAGEKDKEDPGKTEAIEPQPEATFEQNLARERAEEYLGPGSRPPTPPGEADRVARAIDYANELQAAQNDEADKDKKPARGAPAPAKRG